MLQILRRQVLNSAEFYRFYRGSWLNWDRFANIYPVNSADIFPLYLLDLKISSRQRHSSFVFSKVFLWLMSMLNKWILQKSYQSARSEHCWYIKNYKEIL